MEQIRKFRVTADGHRAMPSDPSPPLVAGDDIVEMPGSVYAARSRNGEVRFKFVPQRQEVVLQRTVARVDASPGALRRQMARLASKPGSGGRHPPLQLSRQPNRFVKLDDDEKKGVLDLFSSRFKAEPQVRLVDKVSFTLGVLIICTAEYLVCKAPSYFPDFYRVVMVVLMLLRLVTYFRNKAQFFLIDFCYFLCFSCILQTLTEPDNDLWFRINYVFAMGPQVMAIPVWRNSLVFHDLDKMTSFFLHALPAVLVSLYRFGFVRPSTLPHLSSLQFGPLLPYLAVLYWTWQIFYLLVTEVIFFYSFKCDKKLVTSCRFLTSNPNSLMYKIVVVVLRKVGLLGRDEEIDPDDGKTKVLFVVTQLLYTNCTVILTPWLFESLDLTLGYLGVIFLIGTWNGASFYIDVFSKKYAQQFEKKEEWTPMPKMLAKLFSRQQAPSSGSKSTQRSVPPPASTRGAVSLADAAVELNIEEDLVVDMLVRLQEEHSE